MQNFWSEPYTRQFKDLEDEARFDAEYFNPKYQRVIKKLRASGIKLTDVAPIAQRAFDPTKRERGSTFDYIEIGSLTGDGEAAAERLDVSEAPSRAKWIVKPGDIITSTVRPIRRLSALIRPEQDGYVCSSGFAVLTPKGGKDGIEPEVLLTYLRLPIICELLDLNCTASMYPAIPEERLMRIPFVVPDKKTRKAIVEKVREAIEARREAARLLEQAKKTVEDLIAGGAKERENRNEPPNGGHSKPTLTPLWDAYSVRNSIVRRYPRCAATATLGCDVIHLRCKRRHELIPSYFPGK